AGWHAVGLALIVLTAMISTWRRAGVGHLLVFAIGAWLSSRVRVEQWYEPIGDWAYLLLTLALMELAANFAGGGRGFLAPGWGLAAGGVVAPGLLVFHRKEGRLGSARDYIGDMNVAGMRPSRDVQYFTESDRRAVDSLFKAINPGKPITVEYLPW